MVLAYRVLNRRACLNAVDPQPNGLALRWEAVGQLAVLRLLYPIMEPVPFSTRAKHALV